MREKKFLMGIIAGIILVFSGSYFMLGGQVARAGVKISENYISQTASCLAGVAELWLGLLLIILAGGFLKGRNSR